VGTTKPSGSFLAFPAAFVFVSLGQAHEQRLKLGTLLLRRAFAVRRCYVQAALAVWEVDADVLNPGAGL
jgi:hypothetical protein